MDLGIVVVDRLENVLEALNTVSRWLPIVKVNVRNWDEYGRADVSQRGDLVRSLHDTRRSIRCWIGLRHDVLFGCLVMEVLVLEVSVVASKRGEILASLFPLFD